MRAPRPPRWRVLAAAALALVAVLSFTAGAAAGPPSFETAPAPGWAAPPGIDAASDESTEGVVHGRRNVLFDIEVRVSTGAQQAYHRVVQRIVNETGLQAASQIKIDFDPSYQKLTIHQIVVRRGAEVLDRLDRGAIRLVQREQNLEAQVYDEEVSAILFLEDLRVGDVVDYSFSYDGADPSLGGRYADGLGLAGDEPVDRVRQRVLVPRTRHVEVKGYSPDGADVAPVVRDVGDDLELVWDRTHVKAYDRPADAPASFESAPYAELSEFRSWHDVATLGAQLFEAPAPSAEPVREWARQALRASRSQQDFVLRAVRFVQDEIRYVAIEVGMSRRRPADPAITLRRRYGDCKDKTALLVALLRAAGVPAWPVLVSTRLGATLDRHLPSPAAFDHAIAKASVGEQTYWLDPTVALQGGGLERATHASFARGLVLDPGTKALETMTPEPDAEPALDVHDTFRVAAPGASAETALDSERVYRSGYADAVRAGLRSQSRDRVGDHYLEFYRADFPGIHVTGPVDVSDDREHDVLEVVAHFAMPRFWSQVDGPRPWRVDIAARPLESLLQAPAIEHRTAPLAIPFPLTARYAVTLGLPFDLATRPDQREVDAAAFHLSFASSYAARRLEYRYEITTRAESVEAAALGEHAAALERARALLVRSITYAPPLKDGPHWLNVGIVAAIAAGLVWGARRAYRYQPPPRRERAVDPRWAGLRGWLVLLGINVFLGPFATVAAALPSAKIVFSTAAWGEMTTATRPGYRPALAALVFVELVLVLALAVYGAVLVLTFLGRRRSFPLHFRNFVCANVAISLTDVAGVAALVPGQDVSTHVSALLRGVLFAVVWLAYLHTSRRAAATFVE